MEENQTPIDVDAIFREAFPEQTDTDDAPTAEAPTTTPTPRGEGGTEPSGARAEAPARVPAAEAAATTPDTPPADPKPAEGEIEARLKKAENDLALAKKAQSAADRKVAAYEQARQLEGQRIQQLKAEGRLTQEEVDRAPLLMEGWVQAKEAEAQQADARAETERVARETDAARDEREADLALQKQAIPLYTERATLGLTETDVDPEQLFRERLASDEYAPDVALTWKLRDDPAEAARIYERLVSAAKADVSETMRGLAAAKRETEAKKAGTTQFDRSSSPGPSSGGGDPLPTYTNPDDHLRAHVWRT